MRPGCRLLLLLCLLAATGCRNVQHIDQELLESELRTREFAYRDLLDDFKKTESYNESLQREVEALRKGNKISPEHAAATFGLKRISLGRGTGGYDDDQVPGDEGVYVVLETRDSEDHVIKVPGTVKIDALEINNAGLKLPLCQWDIDENKLRAAWKPGLFSQGYSLQLPWKAFPGTDHVRIVARFTTTDGRTYEADRDIKVRLAAGAVKPKLPPMIEEMPMPKPVMPSLDPGLFPTPPIPGTTPAATTIQKTGFQSAVVRNIILGRPEPEIAPGVQLLGIHGETVPDLSAGR